MLLRLFTLPENKLAPIRNPGRGALLKSAVAKATSKPRAIEFIGQLITTKDIFLGMPFGRFVIHLYHVSAR
jgi:hypothetical protein